MTAGKKKEKITMDKTMLSVDELAARWGMHKQTVYAAIERGEIKAVRVGRSVRISRSHIEHLEANGTKRSA
jgi:excisionase family DNA binding protein